MDDNKNKEATNHVEGHSNLKMPQSVLLNTSTGQLEVSIGNVRYEVIPGSAAELDILGGQYLVHAAPVQSSSNSSQAHSFDSNRRKSQVQQIIGARLGQLSQATFLSSNVVRDSEGDKSKQDSQGRDVFKRPDIPVRFQQSFHDFNQIVSNIETVFSDEDMSSSSETSEGVKGEAEERDVNLPHKKRGVVRALKAIDQQNNNDEVSRTSDAQAKQMLTCRLCPYSVDNQKSFYFHLKVHYEPEEKQTETRVPTKKASESTNAPTKTSRTNPKLKGENKQMSQETRTPKSRTTFHCQACSKLFRSKNALVIHERVHSGERPFNCTECDKTFRQHSDLRYHIQSIHSSMKEFQCEFCGKEFSRKYSLTIHRKIHTGVKDHVCDVCEKAFRAAVYLQCHKRIHTGEKPYPCDACGKSFRVRADMRRHKFHVHQIHKKNVSRKK